MSLGITNAYIGHFSGFQFKPSADVQPNTIVAEGQLLGVTRQKVVAGSTGLAFMGMPAEVWNFALATAATSAISRGVEVYVDSSGKISFSAGENTRVLGVLWSPVASGDTQADIMLYPCLPSSTN
ncbi:MAG: DUF2190 family protein [Planctomycetia bacterium]|nr:DUF2190 family protein [Planctomycetia bacterium]